MSVPQTLFGGRHERALKTARTRLVLLSIFFALSFCVVAGRLVELSSAAGGDASAAVQRTSWDAGRADIVDRNGVLLATSLPTASLYADPHDVLDTHDTVKKLRRVFPDLPAETLLSRLQQNSRFVWIRRNLTPREQYKVNQLGLPGLDFIEEERRVYPQGPVAAHVLGFADIDGKGLAGIERALDQSLNDGQTAHLSIDMRVQNILRQELMGAIREFQAIGAAGLVLDVRTGELLATVSLPDFNPNNPGLASEDARFNRVTQGVYEMGSTFKLFTAAMALDSGTTTLHGGYDASKPIRVARHTIRDYRPKNRWLSVPEILVHSSNIGAAEMALDVGGPLQRIYLEQLGLLQPAAIELPEVGIPLVPSPTQWRDIHTMTIGFGHGISVSPLQLASGVAAVVNSGVFRRPTVIRREGPEERGPGGSSPDGGGADEGDADGDGPGGENGPDGDDRRVISPETSKTMCALMRLIVLSGTGRNADVPGLRIGGKTGTAEKIVGGRYSRNARLSSFIGAFPIDAPRYVVLAMIDEPQGNASTHFYATGGWVAAPVIRRVSERIAPLLGVEPVRPDFDEKAPRNVKDRGMLLAVAMKQAMADAWGRRLASN
ncbi:MAG: peptidoglycan D,D-transpeptidase FtsI family protein [Rhodoplanes sp.]